VTPQLLLAKPASRLTRLSRGGSSDPSGRKTAKPFRV
jgi:hypothetical protein